jgi:hypothetical protein
MPRLHDVCASPSVSRDITTDRKREQILADDQGARVGLSGA